MTLKGRRQITIRVYRWNNAHGGMRFAFPLRVTGYGLNIIRHIKPELALKEECGVV